MDVVVSPEGPMLERKANYRLSWLKEVPQTCRLDVFEEVGEVRGEVFEVGGWHSGKSA